MCSRMEAKDGSFGFDFEAVYDEVNEPETLTYTMADGRSATTTLAKDGSGTKMEIVFDPESVNPAEMQQQASARDWVAQAARAMGVGTARDVAMYLHIDQWWDRSKVNGRRPPAPTHLLFD